MESFFLEYGIWALAIMIFVDEIGLPIFPNGIALFFAAALARTTESASPWAFFAVAVIAAQLGNAILFWGGRHGLQDRLVSRKWRLLPSPERWEKLQKFFACRHGSFTILGVSCLTAVRPFAALMAGSCQMKPLRFFPFNFLGIVLWAGTVTLAGYFLGTPLLIAAKQDWKMAVSILVVLAAYWYFGWRFPWKYFRNKTNENQCPRPRKWRP